MVTTGSGTWGISGPNFLPVPLVVGVVGFGAVRIRARIRHRRPLGPSGPGGLPAHVSDRTILDGGFASASAIAVPSGSPARAGAARATGGIGGGGHSCGPGCGG